MKSDHRYQPSWPLPTYIFIPGENPHPKKMGGHMEGEGDPKAETIDLEHPEENFHLRYALDLYNHKYFWESHVYFEALWNAHQRSGPVADFLKALIKLGAAGVKLNISQPKMCVEHLERARELLVSVKQKTDVLFIGFDLDFIVKQIDSILASSEIHMFQIHPSWT